MKSLLGGVVWFDLALVMVKVIHIFVYYTRVVLEYRSTSKIREYEEYVFRKWYGHLLDLISINNKYSVVRYKYIERINKNNANICIY